MHALWLEFSHLELYGPRLVASAGLLVVSLMSLTPTANTRILIHDFKGEIAMYCNKLKMLFLKERQSLSYG